MKRSFCAVAVLLSAWVSSCATVPETSRESITREQALGWLGKFCSRGYRPIQGELLMKSNTREFKGQFPASVSVEKEGKFFLEATNILGGTVLRIDGSAAAFDLWVPSKPKYSRKGMTRYLGLEVPVLAELLMGDLPCPRHFDEKSVAVKEGRIEVRAPEALWSFERSSVASNEVPVRVQLQPSDGSERVDLEIESWDTRYAKRVRVRASDGEIKWVWKSRSE